MPNKTSPEYHFNLSKTGLVPGRIEKLVHLYNEVESWQSAENIWHGKRLAGRGRRSSSARIFRIWKSYLQSANGLLPNMSKLSTLLSSLINKRSKAQILYFYLLQGDRMVREFLEYLISRENYFDNDFFEKGNLYSLLESFFELHNFEEEYVEKSKRRWLRGIRSVLVKIGALKGGDSTTIETPVLSKDVLLCSAEFSYLKSQDKDKWYEEPFGWKLLFYREGDYNHLIDRILETDYWTIQQSLNKREIVRTYEDDYGWIGEL